MELIKLRTTQKCDVGGRSIFRKTVVGDGCAGNLVVRMVQQREKPEITTNMPKKPTRGWRNWVRIAVRGAAAACPVITRP